MTDRRLQEAFAKEAARQACELVTRAIRCLEKVASATGEHKFEPLVAELREVRQHITAAN